MLTLRLIQAISNTPYGAFGTVGGSGHFSETSEIATGAENFSQISHVPPHSGSSSPDRMPGKPPAFQKLRRG